MFGNLHNREYRAVVLGAWFVICEEEVAASPAASVGFAEVAGISVCCQYHIANLEGKDCLFLSG